MFYGVPQKDTNPIAHRLIERFGSLPAVLEAPARELMQIEGVGENVARLLKVTQAMRCRCTQQQTARQKVVLNSSLKAGEYLCSLLQGRETEALLLVCLDAGKAVRHCEQLESGVSDSISTRSHSCVSTATSMTSFWHTTIPAVWCIPRGRTS